MSGSVCVVIVNYCTADLAIDCLRSIAMQLAQLPKLKVFLIDNDSTDGSEESLREAVSREFWGAWVQIIAAGRNGGFAFGNNVGIRLALASDRRFDYVLLLNPDTIVHDGAISALVEFMDSHPQVGIAGSLLEDAACNAESSAHVAPSPLGEIESSARLRIVSRILHRFQVSPPIRKIDHECDWVSGASLVARREVFEHVGGLDERFFLYFEEVDFCTRARKAGWKVWFVPASRIVHLEGASTGIQSVVSRRPRYWYESRRRYFVKHFGVSGLLAADFLWFIGRMVFVLRRAVPPGRSAASRDPKYFAFDLLWGDMRALFTGELMRIRREAVRS